MNANIKIRPMAMVDVPKVYAIEKVSYPSPWSEKLFFDCLMVGYPAWVLDNAGTVVGYMIISMSVDECHILNICLSEEIRKQGYGEKLLQHGLAFAKKQGMDRAILEVRPTNKAAISMYKKYGFSFVSIRDGYYQDGDKREDAFVYSLNLQEYN